MNGDVGELVAESFLQDGSWAVKEAHGDSDETSLGVASAEAAGHSRAVVDGNGGFECRGSPQRSPIRHAPGNP